MKTVVITGGGGALGSALARGLSNEFKVILLGRQSNRLDQLAKELDCAVRVCDLSKNTDIESAVEWVIEEHKKIDALINNAGVYAKGPIEDIDPAKAEEAFRVNALAPLLLAREVVPHMKRAGGGQIIDINSTAGIYPKVERSVYHGSKHGMSGVSGSLYEELAPQGIGVTSIHPGMLEKSMSSLGEGQHKPEAIPHESIVEAVRYAIKWYPRAFVRSMVIHHNIKTAEEPK